MSARQVKYFFKPASSLPIPNELVSLIGESFRKKPARQQQLQIESLRLPGEFREPEFKLSLDGVRFGTPSHAFLSRQHHNAHHSELDQEVLAQVQASKIKSSPGRLEALQIAEEALRLIQSVPILRSLNLEPVKGRCPGSEGDFIPALVNPEERQSPIKILVDADYVPRAILFHGKNLLNKQARPKDYTLVAIENAMIIHKRDWPEGFAPSEIYY